MSEVKCDVCGALWPEAESSQTCPKCKIGKIKAD